MRRTTGVLRAALRVAPMPPPAGGPAPGARVRVRGTIELRSGRILCAGEEGTLRSDPALSDGPFEVEFDEFTIDLDPTDFDPCGPPSPPLRPGSPCGDEPALLPAACPARDEGGARAATAGCLRPDEVGAEDLAALLAPAVASGSASALRKLRQRLHGDGAPRYAVAAAEGPVRLSAQVWRALDALAERSGGDNRERPFLVAVDEARRRAVRAFVGAVGDENSCTHSNEELLAARRAAPPHTRIAFGHTHPVFWTDPGDPLGIASGGGVYGSGRRRAAEFPRRFGAFPSNIYISLKEWRDAWEEADAPARDAIDAVVLRPKLYKKYGADFCASMLRQHAGANPEGFGPASRFEFIFSPRLRQLGVFCPRASGDCIYVPWVVEEGGGDDGEEVEHDCDGGVAAGAEQHGEKSGWGSAVGC